MTINKNISKRSYLLTPLILSTFLYPGSGQLYLKRTTFGLVLIILSTILLVLFCVDFFATLQIALPIILANIKELDVAQQFLYIQKFVHSELDLSKGGLYLCSILFLWFISILDILLRKE